MDKLFFSVFNYYKSKKNKNASLYASLYITLLQGALLLLLGIFFSEFFRNMNMSVMSSKKAWVLYLLGLLFIYFRNWMYYSGRKRKILNAKQSGKRSLKRSIYVLWLLPLACFGVALILLQILK
ncbi:MAG: hypothetical protein KJO41_01445 [Bacteroidia bacterium]|nr:hypothetical protein [Bacteroidia bacterium]NND25194.1 hypothetical protein [Flavobacteriaceae bacterium]MBT8277636.1 hypothetical protein [Bacteroidia bacterium]NNK60907.1 hypothetical protein [Flavobacteriaceae bacterium]NNL31936.1 hypothetical protein [Flavobacteriaceae bacterium]